MFLNICFVQVGGPVNPVYSGPVVQTISNPDGTVSIIQVDPSNPVIQLPDGTTAHVQGVAHVSIFLCLLVEFIKFQIHIWGSCLKCVALLLHLLDKCYKTVNY